ncbi:ComEC/Rec2 family competence protein [Candidatus Bipolaricaulota bacterium]
MRYALVRASLLFVLGIGVSLAVGEALPALVPWSVAAALTIGAIASQRTSWGRRLLFAAVLALGIARGIPEEPFPSWLILRAQGLTEVTGIVVSYPSLGEDHVVFTLRPDVLPAALRVTWFRTGGTDKAVHYGDRLTVTGSVRLPEAFDGFDYPAYLARRGIFATMTADENGLVFHDGVGGSAILRLGDRVRQSILRRLEEALGPEEVGLAQGLLFGDRAALSDEVEGAFQRTGLMHVLAVSGLHLGIVLAGLWFALRWLRTRPAVAYPIVGLVVLLVLWVVGPRVSLLRASLLFAFLGLGSVLADLSLILRRTVDPLNGLAAAGLILLALRPVELMDAGFQLSFAATAGILVAVSEGSRHRWTAWIDGVSDRTGLLRRPVRAALVAIVISTAAQACVAPVVAWHFGTFHPSLIGFNLVVVPLVTLALWAGLPGLLLFAAGAPALGVAPFGWSLQALSWSVQTLARTPLAEFSIPRWMSVWLAALVLFLFAAVGYSEESSS